MTDDLRDYQSAAIVSVRREMAKGHKRVVLVMPTGSGKTRTAAEVVRQAVSKGRRVLWLAHRVELVRQSADVLADEYKLPVGVVAATESHRSAAEAPVQVASLQTLLARGVRPPADLVVADECHHFSEDGAEEWASLLTTYEYVLGLTATPERGDGTGLSPMFTALVVGTQPRPLVASGHLVPCEILRPPEMLDPGHLAQDPVDAFLQFARNRQTILFARTIALAVEYAARLETAGIVARAVHESTPPDERSLTLQEFRAGRVRVLTNVYVLTEGTDLPMVSCIVLARGAGKPGIYLQMVGRGLRPSQGKTDCLLLDLRGVSWAHGPPEDERIYSLDGRAITRAEQKCPSCSSLRYGAPPHPTGDDCELGDRCGEFLHCPDCGLVPDGAERDTDDEIDNKPLTKYVRKLAESPDQRRESFLRWAHQYKAKGMNPWAALHKFRAVYGVEPEAVWKAELRRIAG